MNRLLSFVALFFSSYVLFAQTSEVSDFNPSNPPNPTAPVAAYTLSLKTTPVGAGTFNTSKSSNYEAGTNVYLRAYNNTSYVFSHWSENGDTISKNSSFYYVMPERSVTLTAVYRYSPSSPANPDTMAVKHYLKLEASPAGAGYFNWSSPSEVQCGQNVSLYAYANTGWRFREMQVNGKTVSNSTSYSLTMPSEDLRIVALYEYNPSSPINPGRNYWNSETGEVIVDDFSAGSLNSTINSLVGSKNDDVTMITVAGRTTSNDWSVANSYNNCTMLDMSRTTGLTAVPSWSFSGNTSLASISLPASIQSIEYYAFRNCTSLQSIACYAITPPAVDSYAFDGVADGMVVYVPASSVGLYQESSGWKNFVILPLYNEVSTLEVNLPEGTNPAIYKDMYLELVNTKSGQKQRYVVTNRLTYTFNSLIHRTSYNIYLKNQQGDVLGEVDGIDIIDQDVSVTFPSLMVPRDLTLRVLTPSGEDVTSQTTITWFDQKDTYLTKGNTLTGQLEGVNVKYRVQLPQTLGMLYLLPADVIYEVQATNSISLTLTDIPQTTISGVVRDVKTGQALSGATIAVSQMLNGLYSKSFTTKTDNQGRWSLQVYEAKTDITASMDDYVSKTQTFETLVADVPAFELKDINGTTISLNLTYTGTNGETQEFYSDYANVAYTVFNETTGRQVTELNVQYPQIVLMEQLPSGTVLRVTATSKNQKFMPVTATATVDYLDRANVTLAIKQLGGITASFRQTDNPSVTAILYNANGQLLKKYDYASATLTISELQDGQYTLVSMANSQFFNSIGSVSQFAEAGLREGIDFVKNAVTVKSGEMTVVENQLIPFLDESKLYYTGDGTSITVNKSQITTGNYLTITGKIDFKQAYANSVSDVKLIVNLPEETSFVENSVMRGSITASYTYSDNQVVVPLDYYGERVRFCFIPTAGGDFTATAQVQFTLNGKTVTQPIGNANFTVQNLSISVPSTVAKTTVPVSGIAPGKSTVEIYDNGTLVGQTTALANGCWYLDVEIPDTNYTYSYHQIYAKFNTPNGMTLFSETKRMIYQSFAVSVESIDMLFGPYKLNLKVDSPSNQEISYTYPTCGKDFSFIVNFTNNDSTAVSNVKVNVLCMDNSIEPLDAFYDAKIGRWIAYGEFSSSSRLPINCNVEFESPVLPFDDSERREQEYSNIESTLQELEDYADNNLEIEMLEDEDNYVSFAVSSPLSNSTWILFAQAIDKSSVNLEDGFYYISDGDYYYKDYCTDDAHFTATIVDKDSAYVVEYYRQTMNESRKVLHAPQWWNNTTHFVDVASDYLMPWKSYLKGCYDYNFWVNEHYPFIVEALSGENEWTYEALNALCSDGTSRLNNSQKQQFFNRLQNLQAQESYFYNTADAMADLWRQKLLNAFYFEGLTASLSKALKAIPHAQFYKSNGKGSGLMRYVVKGGEKKRNQVENLIEKGFEHFMHGLEHVGDWTDFMDYESISKQFHDYLHMGYNNFSNMYSDLRSDIRNSYKKCKKKPNPKNKKFPHNNFKPYIDPSGYVYEAVSSNRLQGVIASCYYKETVEDMYGDLHENVVLWDAEEYAQENPLFTDEYGMYRWDVPQGLWQVKFEKEGYQTTYSDWLPVPPPQLEVNIPMTQLLQPSVATAKAYDEGVEVTFDKYMNPESLTTDNIIVTRNGELAEGTIELLNEEAAYEGQSQTYASKVRFNVSEGKELLSTDEVQLTVRKTVESYAGVQMQDDYVQTFDVEPRVRLMAIDSLVNVGYGSERTLTVAALPADASKGKKVTVKSLSTMIASIDTEELTLDENGQAELKVTGELPGSTVLSYQVEGTDVEGITTVNVKDAALLVTVAPRASRVSGTEVYRGTEIRLTCETENAVIYYTLDGTCPCNTETALVYNPDEPIVIARDNVTIKAMAQGHDLAESDVSEFNYTLKKSTLGYQLPIGWSWISHNMESAVPVYTFETNAERILSQTDEVIKDPAVGLTGTLTELKPAEAYKVKVSADTEKRLEDYEYNATANPVGLSTGWNWIGYPVNQAMTLNEALTFFTPEAGDYIVGQDGFAEYADNQWNGTLDGFVPGKGYLYKSAVGTEIVFNTTIVSTAASRIFKQAVLKNSPWAVDKHGYAEVMPLTAYLYQNGTKVSEDDYLVGAFAGTECRGIGQWKSGRVMMSVYGEKGDELKFIAVDKNTEKFYDITETVSFTSDNVGSWNMPYSLTIGNESTGLEELYSELTVTPAVARDHITVSAGGRQISKLMLTNMSGQNVMIVINPGRGATIATSSLPEGMYIVTVQAEGQTYYKKILKSNK